MLLGLTWFGMGGSAAADQWRTVSRAATPTPAPVTDVLLLRDGTSQSGRLAGCVGVSCTLDGAPVDRSGIEWIGLGVQPPPPQVTAPGVDQLYLGDGSVAPGPLVRITAAEVSTTHGSWPRDDVRWIHLAAVGAGTPPPTRTTPTAGPGGGGGGGGGSPPEGPSPPPPPKGPSPPPPPKVPSPPPPPARVPSPTFTRPPGSPPVTPCPAGKPLGGWLRTEVESYVGGSFNGLDKGCRMTVTGTLRFPLVPDAPAIAGWRTFLWSGFKAEHIDFEVSTAGCVDVPGDDPDCHAPPGRVRGTVVLGRTTQLGYQPDVGGDSGYVDFNPLKPELTTVFPDALRYAITVPFECIGKTEGGSRGELHYGVFGPDIGPGETYLDFNVIPTGGTRCADPKDAELERECMTNPDRYAVIPFSGDVSWRSPKQTWDGPVRSRYRWEICCGCGEKPAGAPPSSTGTPCPDTSQYEAQVDLRLQEGKVDRKVLEKQWAEFQHSWNQALQYRSDYELVIRSCALWEIGEKLLEYVASGGGEAAESFIALAGIVNKIASGDPSWVLAFGGSAEGVSIQGLFDTINTVVSGAESAGKAGSIEGMEDKLQECAGTGMISDAVWQGAKDYLSNLGAALDMMPEIEHLVTTIQQVDLDYWNWRNKLYQACLDSAACRGEPPSVCDQFKPPAAPAGSPAR